jgi:plastocyanin
MQPNRRQLLQTATAVAAGLGLAGCSGSNQDGTPTNTATDAPTDTPASTEDDAEETTGTHEYVCIPHKKMGMKGTVVVEE